MSMASIREVRPSGEGQQSGGNSVLAVQAGEFVGVQIRDDAGDASDYDYSDRFLPLPPGTRSRADRHLSAGLQ